VKHGGINRILAIFNSRINFYFSDLVDNFLCNDGVFKMSKSDVFLMIIVGIFVLFLGCFISYESGKKVQCELDLDYRYSRDFGTCVKLGKGNLK